MDHDAVLSALAAQVSCYRRLAKLAAIQHDHVQYSRTEDLLDVLKGRQEVIDQLMELEKVIGPAKKQWKEYLGTIDADGKRKAEALLAETRLLLEQITNADRNDVMVLQQRKLNIGKQIRQTTVATQVNRNYAAAAYGTARPRMDLST